MKPKLNKIDAKGQSLGRIASQAAFILQGKNRADYKPYIVLQQRVVVHNLAHARFTGKKLSQKKYHKFTGYPSGIKSKKMGEFFNKDPKKLFMLLIYNMLPKNKLRPKMLKNLDLYNEELNKKL